MVVERGIDRVVAGFRNAPRHIALCPIGDLPFDCRVVSAVEQRVLKRWHHQQRHQVFEHRTAPGHERRLAAGGCEQAAECEPAFLRQLALRNRHETAQPRLRRQHVVVTCVQTVLANVVADREQMARFVVQEVEFHCGQFA